MHRRTCRKRRVKKRSGVAEELHAPIVLNKLKNKTNSAFYKSGPMLAIPDKNKKTPAINSNNEAETIATIKGKGSQSEKINKAGSVSLQGETRADFNGGSFETQNVRVSRAGGCESCGGSDPCIRARGSLVARYHVTTTVTLPAVDDFPDLTPCQRERVRDAIDNVLVPHEQQHVSAFRQYNGVIRTPFDVTLCRSDFNSTIQDMFERQESSRRDSAQAASDALDPFTFTVDIDCDEPSDESSTSTENNTGQVEESDESVVEEPGIENEKEELTS